jgi:ATP:ADP antiporter, AAA family
MSKKEEGFGTLRAILWPVHRSELKKVLSMFAVLFLLCICYSILRNLKDTIVLTADHSGAEVIPFLKVWGMLPGVIAATWCYTRLARRFSREKIFYLVVSSFLVYFLSFAFFIYPHSNELHLDWVGNFLSQHLPSGFKGFIAMIRNWTFTSFYIISELWSSVVLTVIFWGFANDNTEVSQAKRTYGILNIGSNVAPILGGGVAILCSASVCGSWVQTLQNSSLALAFLGSMAMCVFYWINRKVVVKKSSSSEEEGSHKKEKPKLSIRESIRYISKSRYLTYIAVIVLGYNISINITDILWKEQLRRFFTDPNEMLIHMSLITVGTGIFATMGGLLFSFLVNRLGWTFVAILPPLIMTVMAFGFFVFLFTGDALTSFAMMMFGSTPLALTVYFGSLQNCLSKAGKYSLFDASKEIAFLPLDPDSKLKGKAAIDGLGSGIGKSGSSIAYQGLIITQGSVAASTPYICAVLAIVLTFWISSVVNLGKLFKKESLSNAT